MLEKREMDFVEVVGKDVMDVGYFCFGYVVGWDCYRVAGRYSVWDLINCGSVGWCQPAAGTTAPGEVVMQKRVDVCVALLLGGYCARCICINK